MFVEILIALAIGVTAGIFTGLCPGVHINLVAVLMLSISPFLLMHTNVLCLAVFIVAMSVTHTFLDSIPSIFLGAPEESTALGVLPGHRYLLKGYGYMAVKLTLIGSYFGLLISIALFFLIIPIVKFYPYIQKYMAYILILIVVFMILRDRRRWLALYVFLLSGVFGYIVLNIPNFKDPLFPMLSGLFGVSTLIVSLMYRESIPIQKIDKRIKLKKRRLLPALLSGQFSGFVTAILPGIGAGTAAIMSLQITRKLKDHGFMILLGSIGIANFVFSIATFYVIDKARNGTIAAIQELMTLNLRSVIIILSAAIIAGGIALFLGIRIGRIFSRLISRINYKKIVIAIILLVVVLTVLLTGPLGLFILIIATAIGVLPALWKVSRTHTMGCLLLPVILYFI